MTNNSKAVVTLIRNKLNSKMTKKAKLEWFSEKGIDVKNDKDLYFFKNNSNLIKSELTDVCNGLIFRGSKIVSYPGAEVKEFTLEEARKLERFIWNEDSFFIEYIQGIKVFMFWDPGIKDWNFSSEGKLKTPHGKRVKKELYNIMSAEEEFTYCFKIIEQSEKAGIYLETMYNNKNFKEMPWKLVYKFATKMKTLHPVLYKFEGFDKLEEDDFPLTARDAYGNKILITSIK